MPDKDNRETIRKIINAVEHPDTSKRQATIAVQKSREQNQSRSEHVFVLIFRFLFIALLVAILFKTWSDRAVGNPWTNLIIGAVAGIAAWLAIERRKQLSQKSLPPSVVLIAGISILTLLASIAKSLIPSPVTTSITIVGISFLLVISLYAFVLAWRVIKKDDAHKSSAS